jgi:hypothetical protein
VQPDAAAVARLAAVGLRTGRAVDAALAAPAYLRDKVALDSGRRPELASDLLRIFDSQISGGKRYDLATIGRRSANATYHTSHASDQTEGITWAMDLTPLVTSPTLDLVGYTQGYIDRLRTDVTERIKRMGEMPAA